MTSRRGAYGSKTAQTSPSNFGERLRRIRIAWGWTQSQLAESLGSNQRLVSHWERGIATPSGAAMTALSSLIGMSSEALLSGKGFSIPNLPARLEGVSKEDAARCSALSKMLPRTEPGGVVLLDLDSYRINQISITEAVQALKNARSEGNEAWVVIKVAR